MSEFEMLRERLEGMERRLRWMGGLVVILLGAVVLGAAVSTGAGDRSREVLTVRGLVVTDDQGRERLVLGAPMGEVSEDPKLSDATGLAVLDSVGHLNVAVGANNPLVLAGGKTGERIAASAGITFYDPRNGKERGGMGAFADGRANVCLDYDQDQKEAACMAVAPGDQYAAVLLNGTPDEEVYDRVVMYVGADGIGQIKAFGGDGNQSGVLIRGGDGPARITVHDSTGAVITDLTDGS